MMIVSVNLYCSIHKIDHSCSRSIHMTQRPLMHTPPQSVAALQPLAHNVQRKCVGLAWCSDSPTNTHVALSSFWHSDTTYTSPPSLFTTHTNTHTQKRGKELSSPCLSSSSHVLATGPCQAWLRTLVPEHSWAGGSSFLEGCGFGLSWSITFKTLTLLQYILLSNTQAIFRCPQKSQ